MDGKLDHFSVIGKESGDGLKEILAAHSIEAKLLFTALLELNDELLEHNLHLLSCTLGIGDRILTLQCGPRLGCGFWLCWLPLLLLLLFVA